MLESTSTAGVSAVAGLLSLFVVCGGVYLVHTRRQRDGRPRSVPRKAVPVGKVVSLTVYPVKTLWETEVPAALCTKRGLISADGRKLRDRSWMVLNNEKSYVSLREEPKLALLRPTAPSSGNILCFDAPNMPSLRVSTLLTHSTQPIITARVYGSEARTIDCGYVAADWISTFLKKPGFRLVYLPKDMPGRRPSQAIIDDLQKFNPAYGVTYPEMTPLSLLSDASLKDLNKKMKKVTVSKRNFRPNIVVDGCKAFAEDYWKELYIGQAKLVNANKCNRGLLSTIDPSLGNRLPKNEPLRTLRTYRLLEPSYGKSPCFGVNLSVAMEGTINVGDTVYAVIEDTV